MQSGNIKLAAYFPTFLCYL